MQSRVAFLGLLSPGARFAFRYALLVAVLFSVYCFPYAESGISERWFTAYLCGYAEVVGAFLRLFEPGLVVSGATLSGRFSLEIAKNCDAIEVLILFLSAVLALPGSLARRVIAALAGSVLIVFANLIRITSLYFIGVHSPASFEFFHVTLWPLLLVALAALEFVLVVSFGSRGGRD